MKNKDDNVRRGVNERANSTRNRVIPKDMREKVLNTAVRKIDYRTTTYFYHSTFVNIIQTPAEMCTIARQYMNVGFMTVDKTCS